jgi:hypothetical protein
VRGSIERKNSNNPDGNNALRSIRSRRARAAYEGTSVKLKELYMKGKKTIAIAIPYKISFLKKV